MTSHNPYERIMLLIKSNRQHDGGDMYMVPQNSIDDPRLWGPAGLDVKNSTSRCHNGEMYQEVPASTIVKHGWVRRLSKGLQHTARPFDAVLWTQIEPPATDEQPRYTGEMTPHDVFHAPHSVHYTVTQRPDHPDKPQALPHMNAFGAQEILVAYQPDECHDADHVYNLPYTAVVMCRHLQDGEGKRHPDVIPVEHKGMEYFQITERNLVKLGWQRQDNASTPALPKIKGSGLSVWLWRKLPHFLHATYVSSDSVRLDNEAAKELFVPEEIWDVVSGIESLYTKLTLNKLGWIEVPNHHTTNTVLFCNRDFHKPTLNTKSK